MKTIIVDAGPIVALLNRHDKRHAWAREVFEEVVAPAATCDAVLTEACFLLRQISGGQEAVLRLLSEGILTSGFRVSEEVGAIRSLIQRFADVPISLADACLIRMTELQPDSAVVTFDSDFQIYRRNRRQMIPTITPD